MSREQIEEKGRTRWLRRLVQIIMDADLPLVKIAQQTLQPEATLATAAQGRRLRTLRQRVRTFLKASTWFSILSAVKFPLSEAQVLDYMRDRADEPCGRTCLRSFISSLAFIERGGAVPPQDRLSSRASVLEAMEEWTLEVSGPGGSARKKANPFFILIIISLELVVMDETLPNYKRAFAWFKLPKTWASLRFGDTVSLAPTDAKFQSEFGLECRLRKKTKTPGPGKHVVVLFAFISVESVVIANQAWLETGHKLWSLVADFERDYFLPLPSGDLLSSRECRRSTSTSPACPGLSLPRFPRSTR